MKNQTATVEETQGVVTTKDKNDSFPYAIKQLKEYIEKVKRNKWLKEEDLEQLIGVHKKTDRKIHRSKYVLKWER